MHACIFCAILCNQQQTIKTTKKITCILGEILCVRTGITETNISSNNTWCCAIKLEVSDRWILTGQRIRSIIWRGQTAAFLFELSAKWSTKSKSIEAHPAREKKIATPIYQSLYVITSQQTSNVQISDFFVEGFWVYSLKHYLKKVKSTSSKGDMLGTSSDCLPLIERCPLGERSIKNFYV